MGLVRVEGDKDVEGLLKMRIQTKRLFFLNNDETIRDDADPGGCLFGEGRSSQAASAVWVKIVLTWRWW